MVQSTTANGKATIAMATASKSGPTMPCLMVIGAIIRFMAKVNLPILMVMYIKGIGCRIRHMDMASLCMQIPEIGMKGSGLMIFNMGTGRRCGAMGPAIVEVFRMG